MATTTQWIDAKDDKFDGCLLILNISNENYHKVDAKYIEMLQTAVGDAHADGWMVLYAFDNETDPAHGPEIFDSSVGMDYVRMMFDVCDRKDAKFDLMPDKRKEEFRAIAKYLRAYKSFKFHGPIKICGQCYVGGEKVLLPPLDAY